MVNGVKSDWAPVLSGVPQGTVHRPLLFSMYINYITEDIDSELRLFAMPGRFGPIPVRPGRFGPISEVSRFGPVGEGRFGPIS